MIPESVQSGPVGRGRGGGGSYPLSLNVVRTLLLKVREHGNTLGEVLGEKLAPFPALFGGNNKKMFATNFFSYIHVKNKEDKTVAEKMQ